MGDTPSVDELRAAALAYASRGWRVFPVQSGEKNPATAHGLKDGTTDESQIRAWWQSVPYNIGVVTGPESGIFVVDVDPRNGGAWTPEVQTYTVLTGGGGFHYYFTWPAGVAKLRPRLAQGVDVKGAGGYVVAPPSVTSGSYVVDGAGDPFPVLSAPPALLSLIAIAEGAVNVDARPGDIFNATHTWAELLEPYGWQSTGRMYSVDSEELEGWIRPGKDEGVSATTGIRSSQGNPADLLYVFTTSTSLEPDRGYDKFGFWAAMEFDGDVSAAATALSSLTVRQSPPPPAPGPPVSVPRSPAGRQPFESVTPAEHFVAKYVAYGQSLTDAAPEYHEAAALALLAAVTPRVRIELAPFPGGLHTNLYLALVGESSRSRKSTVQQIAKGFIERLQQDIVLPDRMTGEAGIQQLAQRSGKTALWMPDELGNTIAEVYGVSFMSALDSVLLTLYSGQQFKYYTQANQTTVQGVHFVIFGAATPESFSAIGSRAISSGLLPRFGVVYPDASLYSRPPSGVTEEQERARQELEGLLREVMYLVEQPGGRRSVTFTAEALAYLGDQDAQLSKHRLTTRLSVAAYKVAALLALANKEWVVDLRWAAAASVVVQRWAQGALRLRAHLGRPAADYAFMELLDISRETLRNAQGLGEVAGRKRIQRQEAARLLKLEHRTLNRVRDSLADTGEIQVVLEDGQEEWCYVAL